MEDNKMNEDLIKYIKNLTKNDKKTLSQKALKTMEEVGELSRVILPFENAAGTVHRFSDKEAILEESVDSILCLLSIAYETGATDEDIEKMMWKKAEKWNSLQVNELANPFPLPFELHVTVELDVFHRVSSFEMICHNLGLKAIILDLYEINGTVVSHEAMTGFKMLGNNKQAYDRLVWIDNELTSKGFRVTRTKIETVPWHPATFTSKLLNNTYYEFHMSLYIKEKAEKDALFNDVYSIGGVISVNVNKNNDGTKFLATFRSNTKNNIQEQLENIKLKLKQYSPSDALIEYAIYDTNVSHDSSWINS
jgi:NTP pyrophosphatase (non-canonical NTP hydrolase)